MTIQISIIPGSNGKESIAWAVMLHRMYYRWAQHCNHPIVKNVLIDGLHVLGIETSSEANQLQNEDGIHRLVRRIVLKTFRVAF